MTTQELAQKILDWIKSTEERMAQEKPLQTSRLTVLVDGIKELCEKQCTFPEITIHFDGGGYTGQSPRSIS